MHWQAKWIWTDTPVPNRNAFVRFRRIFSWNGSKALLHITADARYVLYINGQYIGQGPVRSWPAHWKYDTYDISPYLVRGDNVLAVLVNHYGEGNFQYISAPPGLLAQLELADGSQLFTDGKWLTSPDPAFASIAPRISVQEAFEEQYDARASEAWTKLSFAPTDWRPAIETRSAGDPPHINLEPRGIPLLTLEPIQPQRIVSVEAVESVPHRWHLHLKPYLHPSDSSSNHVVHHAYVFTQIWSPHSTKVQLLRPHHHQGQIKLNGELVQSDQLELQAGWNQFLCEFSGTSHLQAMVFALSGPAELKFACRGEKGGSPWALVGPFELTEHLQRIAAGDTDSVVVINMPRSPAATAQRGVDIWTTGLLDAETIDSPLFQEIQPDHLPADSFLQSYTDRALAVKPQLENPSALLSANHEWATVYPCASGDVRLLLDFGREVVGFHRFEVEGEAGTVLDWHNFEFIQPDGRYNFAEGMNNSFRYTMKEGAQLYQSYVRRGFQYSYLTIRNLKKPLRIRKVEVLFNTYPQARRGSFACSNAQLDRIWEVGAHSLRCCAEDTYVDCPTYEQTYWVGDGRNESLIDWVINGDPDLWYRCLEQTGQSLERSPLTESHVPSAWQNTLPAWSFLWMRSCREYLLFTGDFERSRRLLSYLRQNVAGIRKHLNAQNLFDIKAWNMFDWAAMDTPAGVVTHQNCFAVLALRECAEMAEWLGENEDAKDWRDLAVTIAEAINTHLWNEERQAYTDCLRDGKHSAVFSQQTQTVAYMSDVAQKERAQRCRDHMLNPPEGFVRAGSPFFEFFLLEAAAREGRDQEFLETILRDWGFMVDMGASTFWEMWSMKGGRLTRSHCHGWSAAPTYFLSTHVLGVQPISPGFTETVIAPRPANLTWCRGSVPTPYGDINIQWEDNAGQPFQLRIEAPQELKITIKCPRQPAHVTLNGQPLEICNV